EETAQAATRLFKCSFVKRVPLILGWLDIDLVAGDYFRTLGWQAVEAQRKIHLLLVIRNRLIPRTFQRNVYIPWRFKPSCVCTTYLGYHIKPKMGKCHIFHCVSAVLQHLEW